MSAAASERDIRDRFLRTIANCAHRLGGPRVGMLPLLRQAAALHWRLHPASKPLAPDDIEERLSWPVEDWLDSSIRGDYAGALHIGGFPSSTCSEIMLEVDQVAGAELVQNVVKRVRDTCRLRDGGELLYRRFRQYVIEHPVMGDDSSARELLVPLGVELRELYVPVPEHLKRGKQFYPCPICGWPLNVNSAIVACQSTWCVAKAGAYSWSDSELRNNGSTKTVSGHAASDALMLLPPIWKFTVVPGLLELSIASQIVALGLEARLWPGVDAADVQITVRGTVINIDAKVWRSPSRLATHLKSLAAAPPSWIVIPDFMDKNLRYLREQSPASMRVLTESGCIKVIRRLWAR